MALSKIVCIAHQVNRSVCLNFSNNQTIIKIKSKPIRINTLNYKLLTQQSIYL